MYYMDIDNTEDGFEFYGGFYQTERMIATNFYETFKYIFFCNCFTNKAK